MNIDSNVYPTSSEFMGIGLTDTIVNLGLPYNQPLNDSNTFIGIKDNWMFATGKNVSVNRFKLYYDYSENESQGTIAKNSYSSVRLGWTSGYSPMIPWAYNMGGYNGNASSYSFVTYLNPQNICLLVKGRIVTQDLTNGTVTNGSDVPIDDLYNDFPAIFQNGYIIDENNNMKYCDRIIFDVYIGDKYSRQANTNVLLHPIYSVDDPINNRLIFNGFEHQYVWTRPFGSARTLYSNVEIYDGEPTNSTCFNINKNPEDGWTSYGMAIPSGDALENSTITAPIIENIGTDELPMLVFWRPGTTAPAYKYLTRMWFKKSIERFMTCTGLYWTGNITSAERSELGENCTDEKIRIAKLDEYGYTDGTPIYGGSEEWAVAPNPKWENLEDSFYTPESEPPRTDDTIEMPWAYLNANSLVKQYAITPEMLETIRDNLWLNATDSTWWENLYGYFTDGAGLYAFSDLLDYIVSVRIYPFDFFDLTYTQSTTNENISFAGGALINTLPEGSSQYPAIFKSVVDKIPAGTIKIDDGKITNSFLDTAPYCNVSMFVPYCGMVDLPPEECMGDLVQLNYTVDFNSGACSAIIYNSTKGYPIKEVGGTIGCDLPLSSKDDNIVAGIANSAISLATGNYVGGAVSLADTLNLGAIPPASSSMGGGTAVTSLGQPQEPYIQIKRLVNRNPDNYAHTVGNLVNKTYKLSSLSGYVVCRNVDVQGIVATQEELDAIKNLLESGVYV